MAVIKMYDSIVKLAKTEITTDDIGNDIPLINWDNAKEIFCEVMSVSQTEFYAAAQTGFKPSLKIKIADYYDYNNENALRYNEKEYSIIRTYRDGMSLEITAERIENEL